MLSSGTAEGIDVAVFLASMLSEKELCFYYCDEHFSYIQSDMRSAIFGLMVERLGRNEATDLHYTQYGHAQLESPEAYVRLYEERDGWQ